MILFLIFLVWLMLAFKFPIIFSFIAFFLGILSFIYFIFPEFKKNINSIKLLEKNNKNIIVRFVLFGSIISGFISTKVLLDIKQEKREKALEIAQQIQKEKIKDENFNKNLNIARLKFNNNFYNESYKAFKEAENYGILNKNDKKKYFFSMKEIGYIEYHKKNYSEAEEIFKRYLYLDEENKNDNQVKIDLSKIYFEQGKNLILKGNYDNSLNFLYLAENLNPKLDKLKDYIKTTEKKYTETHVSKSTIDEKAMFYELVELQDQGDGGGEDAIRTQEIIAKKYGITRDEVLKIGVKGAKEDWLLPSIK